MSDSASSGSHAILARLGRALFPRRLWVGLAVVAIAAFFVNPRHIYGQYQALGTAVSLSLILLGLAGRAWAAGCAGQHTREATIEAPALVTGGPFAYVRNPIYLSSIVLGFGMVGLIGDPVLLAMHIAICVVLYAGIVPAEEQFLKSRFGEDYVRYCAHVPRFFPRLHRWESARPVTFDSRAWLDQGKLALILVGIYFGLTLAARLRTTIIG